MGWKDEKSFCGFQIPKILFKLLLHAYGLIVAHNAPLRDKYISINWDYIQEGRVRSYFAFRLNLKSATKWSNRINIFLSKFPEFYRVGYYGDGIRECDEPVDKHPDKCVKAGYKETRSNVEYFYGSITHAAYNAFLKWVSVRVLGRGIF